MTAEPVEGVRISPVQRRVWLLSRGLGWRYGARCVFHVSGRVDVDRLQRAVCQVQQRHEILRTDFRLVKGAAYPLQIVNETHHLPAFNHSFEQNHPPGGSGKQSGKAGLARSIAENDIFNPLHFDLLSADDMHHSLRVFFRSYAGMRLH
jgi:hypothetical protein